MSMAGPTLCEHLAVRRVQTSYFFLAQHHRQFLGFFGINQIVQGQVAPLQNLLVEKTQRRHVHLDAACCALLFGEQVELISAYLLGAKLFWRLAEILGELLDSNCNREVLSSRRPLL